MYTCILVFFIVFLKKRNISSKIKRWKVTEYAALISESNTAELCVLFRTGNYNAKAIYSAILLSKFQISFKILRCLGSDQHPSKTLSDGWHFMPATHSVLGILVLK